MKSVSLNIRASSKHTITAPLERFRATSDTPNTFVIYVALAPNGFHILPKSPPLETFILTAIPISLAPKSRSLTSPQNKFSAVSLSGLTTPSLIARKFATARIGIPKRTPKLLSKFPINQFLVARTFHKLAQISPIP